MNIIQTSSAAPSNRKTQSLTRILLLCGAIAGPFFLFIWLVQDYTRPGFDPRLDLLSLLSLGDWGWVQIANFILAGVLNLLYAVGLWRRLHPGRGGTRGPILIGAYGLGLIVVGIFRTDPANGFPPGVPAATQPSWHGDIHALGALGCHKARKHSGYTSTNARAVALSLPMLSLRKRLKTRCLSASARKRIYHGCFSTSTYKILRCAQDDTNKRLRLLYIRAIASAVMGITRRKGHQLLSDENDVGLMSLHDRPSSQVISLLTSHYPTCGRLIRLLV